jgi:hypothetical protein
MSGINLIVVDAGLRREGRTMRIKFERKDFLSIDQMNVGSLPDV